MKIKNKESARLQILRCAAALFYDKGYSDTTIRMIAAETGLNSSMVNYYFQSKELLYVEILKNLERPLKLLHCDTEKSWTDNIADFISQSVALLKANQLAAHLALRESIHPVSDNTKLVIENLRRLYFKTYKTCLQNHPQNATADFKEKENIAFRVVCSIVKETIQTEDAEIIANLSLNLQKNLNMVFKT